MKTRRTSFAVLAGAAATALGASGVLAGPHPAHAYPPAPLAPACHDWKHNGAVVINEASGMRTELDWDGYIARGPAQSFKGTKTTNPLTGSVGGGIKNGHVDFTITWDPENYDGQVITWGSNHYVGDVDPEWGSVRGVVTDSGGVRKDWVAQEHFDCATPAAQPAAPPPAAQPKTATVAGDVDVYNIAADEVPDEGSGVVGTKIGMLPAGKQVQLAKPCKADDWCQVLAPELPNGNGFIWGHLTF
jgi:hypothetical protein